eukprot:m.296305 g.296305  ORF g.296305 m.296305 type:complete len:57 (+) comp27191_c1_seq2:1946-2116(+)
MALVLEFQLDLNLACRLDEPASLIESRSLTAGPSFKTPLPAGLARSQFADNLTASD